MTTGDPLDYQLAPATTLLWREPDAVHLELGARAVVLEGMPARLVSLIATRTRLLPPVDWMPDAQGPAAAPQVAAALDELRTAGYLWSRRPGDVDERLSPPVPRLARELAALTTSHGESAAAVLAGRRRARVAVCGSNAAVAHLAAVLAAAGVGRVRCICDGSARLWHATPGGTEPGDEGTDLGVAAAAAIRRAAPESAVVTGGARDAVADAASPPPLEPPDDLVVLVPDGPVGDDRRAALHAARMPHLVVDLAGERGTVGPLVLPGLTACLRCADLHRRDRDPAWPVLAVQLAVRPLRARPVSVALATTVVGLAAAQVLAFVDGAAGGEPAVLDGSLEIEPPDWRVRRRSRPPHPDCDCAEPDEIDTGGITGTEGAHGADPARAQ